MGNPATVKKKATEKRRKKYEARLGPGAYLPKEDREQVNAEMKKFDAAEKVRLEKASAERKAKKAKKEKAKKAQALAAANAPPAATVEKTKA